MARFRAYSSASSEDESDDDRRKTRDASSAAGDGSSSELDEQDLVPSSPTRIKKVARRDDDSDDASESDSNGEEEDDGSEDTESSDSEQSEPSRQPLATKEVAGSAVPWAQRVRIDAQKMHVMQASLFRVPEETKALKALNQPAGKAQLKFPGLQRKHSRESEGDSMRVDSRKRASFAHDVNPQPHRPSRKYARVDTLSSVVADNESANVDAGLSRGRSFRVGWGPSGTLVHLGQLCSPSTISKVSANSSILTFARIPSVSNSHNDQSDLLNKLLQHHLSNTTIEMDEDGVPMAYPSRSLRFSSFATLFSLADTSPEACLYRLGQALFDEVDLRFPHGTPPDIRQRATALQRKAALSTWLQNAVSTTMEAELITATSPLSRIFALLTGNQVEKACETAAEGGYPRLASLIAQAGADLQFREDLQAQLDIWRDQSIDCHIDKDLRKIYALLAGLIDEIVVGSKGSGIERCDDVDVLAGLDWKRVFGLCLWAHRPVDGQVADAYKFYNEIVENSQEAHRNVAPPHPLHLAGSSSSSSLSNPPDALFSLIKLYADPTCSLSQILHPSSFGPSSLDYSMCWHLYILLSRCMRIRDFGDRGDPGLSRDEAADDTDLSDVEGHSPSADVLASTYALQLERMGLVQEAAFILLHLEGSAGRRKAIKDLLARSAQYLDEWNSRGLLGSLKLPLEWLNEAKATLAISQGDYFLACELHFSAGRYTDAFNIAVSHLAPDAVLSRDFNMLQSLFTRFEGKPVEGWFTRGKVFLDYVKCMTRLPDLLKSVQSGMAVPDASEASELEEYTRLIPRSVGLIPDILRDRSDRRHEAAAAEMAKGLLLALDQIKPLALTNLSNFSPLDETAKLHHIRSRALAKFMKDVDLMAVA
ncbi:nuclear protein 96-domain-containing protein [Pterulicium gracile]|uniref:Nuclear protein 96-domain-containing protein n=1 Tax=Pterulicium gracile TaxID=1884261 RepID=A0A5C3QT25_9AGAR|nr:nuclear protein 96-domain-containing protein [Pterula gracilis]